MVDSEEAAMIMAKVHECKRKAHDLRDTAHALTARAAIKGCPPVGNEVQGLLAEARSLEREADDLLLELTAPLVSPGAREWRVPIHRLPLLARDLGAASRLRGSLPNMTETGPGPGRGARRP
jgi:hypothetical protein